MMEGANRRHLLFLDECGTHDMRHVLPDSRIFVLLGLLVGESYYAKTLVPRVKALKMQFGISLDVPLHSRHIRRWEGAFRFLSSLDERQRFYCQLNALFKSSRIRIYAVAIDKHRLLERYLLPVNPYNVSISQLLSVVCGPPGTPSVVSQLD